MGTATHRAVHARAGLRGRKFADQPDGVILRSSAYTDRSGNVAVSYLSLPLVATILG